MQTPRLNLDVLANVCKFLGEKSDVLSVSFTCSSAHAFAVRWLLSTHPVHLKSGLSIHRFHSFLLANAPARAPYLRALQIDLRQGPRPQAEDTSALVEILTLCNNIEQLTIAFKNTSWPTFTDPRLLSAINAIRSLRSFTARSESIDALALLPHLHTPLRTLGIHSSNIPVTSRHPAVLQQFLSRELVRTLEELRLDRLAIDLHGGVGVQAVVNLFLPSVLNVAPYPAVRSLLVGSLKGRPLLRDLQHLFPALDGTLYLGGPDAQYGEDTYSDIRAVNYHSQESDADGMSHAWKKLDRIICDPRLLYVLRLRCPIRLVLLESGFSREDRRYAADALRENPVPRLKLSALHDIDPAFGDVFSPELAGTLTHLTLCFFYSNNYSFASPSGDGSGLEWDRVLERIISAIRPLHRLTHLHIVIGVSVYVHKCSPWPFAPWEEYAQTFRESRFNWEGTASTLAHALPSLQNVFLTTNGFLSNWDDESSAGGRWKPYKRWHVTHGWHIDSEFKFSAGPNGEPGGERSLRKMHDDVAETIVKKEELVISKMEEANLHLNYGWGLRTPPLSVP